MAEMTRQEIVMALNTSGGQPRLSGLNLSGLNFRAADLRGTNLVGANLSHADLTGADLSGADLSKANLQHALVAADKNVKFYQGFRQATFVLANLSGADLRYANIKGADLQLANLSGADLRGAYISETQFREANLSGADLRSVQISEVFFTGANLKGANLSGTRVLGTFFTKADLTGADLSGADLRQCLLNDIHVSTGEVVPGSGCCLRDAKLTGADLRGVNLQHVDLTGADLKGAKREEKVRLGPEEKERLEPQEKAKWYQRKPVVILLLIIFLPVGILVLWESPEFSTRTKGFVTAIALMIFFGVLFLPRYQDERQSFRPERSVARVESKSPTSFGQTLDATSLKEQVEAEKWGAMALRSAIGDEPGVISVTADSHRGVVISLRGEMWRGLLVKQKQALAELYMGIVLRGNGNISVPIDVETEDGRVATSMNHPMRMKILR